MYKSAVIRWLGGAAAVAMTASGAFAQGLDSTSIAGLKWRNVGPATFEGRLSDVVGIPGPSKTIFVAAAAGGIWKSTNAGLTWRPVFDDKRIISMGMLAIAPSDTQQVWAGTGEPNSRNTIEPGAGIYKSNDGGLTWNLMGLEKTQHIGRIVVHPKDPNTVYVAALGAAWTSSKDRGLYKTTDGGKTWNLIKFVSDKAGFVDVALDPRNPDVVYATSWERFRNPYSLKSGGPGSGLFKSTDAGKTWTEIKGNGFPEGTKGRIGLAVAPSNGDVVYALTEAADPSKDGSYTPQNSPKANGLYRSTDAGKTWAQMNNYNVRPFYYSQVRVDPRNADRVYFSSTQLQVSDDGGKTSRGAAQSVHVDDHGIWIDPNDPERWYLANDGGVSITFDRGGNFIQTTTLPIGQFYEVSYDYATPYNICGGAQDNGSWCGPSKRKGPVNNSYWFTYAGGDGFYSAQDPTDPNIIYGESQGGSASRVNLKTGERMSFRKPSWQDRYKQWEDSIAVVRGDPLKAETKEQTKALALLRAQQKSDSVDLALRFNWNTPLVLSHHNPSVVYFGGNRLLKSTKKGEDLYLISPDLSKKQQAKIDTSIVYNGGITLDATGAETYGTIVAFGESYLKAGLIFAGTDDGNVWKSPNDGATWENLSTRFPGLPAETWVARIETSHFDTLTFWVAFEGHRSNDFMPYLYVTNDGGKSFKSIANNLPNTSPADYLHVIREDPYNKDLLFVGSSLSAYVSLDRGATWSKFGANLPSVPVFDLKIHPRDHELIAATHGRSFWIAPIAPLEQMTPKVMASNVHLFEPRTAYQWGEGPTLAAGGNGNAQAFFATPSPTYGADISYRVAGAAAGGQARIAISDASGDVIATLNGPAVAGLHTVSWNFQGRRSGPAAAPAPLSASERRDSILKAVRAPAVLDSLAKAKYDTAAIARAKAILNPPTIDPAAGGRGGRGGGGGGGGGRGAGAACERPLTQWEPFCARPGEAAPTPARGGGAADDAAGGGRGGRGGAPESDAVKKIFDLIGLKMPAQGGGRGGNAAFGGGAGGNFTAGTGDYLVTLTIGTTTLKQKLHVERVSGGDDASGGFGLGDDDHDRTDRSR